ncbi:acyl-CoA dehydrogenase family protein [Streptomyces sp. NPDC004647]|uniref:acyl-CoA dehydrogenase family protein n=1 Tax=Streptomyces sp. NPDC004647 TaxID=3154671 RepID=UPI0033B4A27A
MSFTTGCVGMVWAGLEAAVRHAGERKQFGTPIAGHQLLQKMIEDTAVALGAARLPTWRVADHIGLGLPCAAEPRWRSCTPSEAAERCANNALQIFGG